MDTLNALKRIAARDKLIEALEQAFADICEELGCEQDNEAALRAISRLRSELEQAKGKVEKARISFEAIHSFTDSEMEDGDAARRIAECWLKLTSTDSQRTERADG